MKHPGRPCAYVFGLWIAITVISGIAAVIGFGAFRNASPDVVAAVTAFAAGAMLAMLVDTMIPEAFDDVRTWAGLVTVCGFLVAFILTKAGS